MLKRDESESKRLDFQHNFMRALGQGNILHPSISRHEIRAVADMGTGTGIWLNDMAEELQAHRKDGRKMDLIGFDVSAQQFPSSDDRLPEVDFVVQDITTPFPEQYHNRFDVVNMRFLVYALNETDLQKTVDNVAETLRPGGYMQWQEIDSIDVWATPAIKLARDAVFSIVHEKAARGLVVSMPTQLVKAILKPTVQDKIVDGKFISARPDSSLNALSWNHDLFRILSLETVSTYNHPSSKVQAEKNAVGLAINRQLLLSGAARMRDLSRKMETVAGRTNELVQAAGRNEELAAAIKTATDDEITTWNADMTWIIARKAMIVPLSGDWMGARWGDLAHC